MLQEVKGHMLSDAAQLTVKIASAEGGDLFAIRMECAAIIRKSANDLMVQNHSLAMFDFEYMGYFQIVCGLIEEYSL